MRTILLIVLGLFIAQKLDAQSDSLILKVGEYTSIVIISPNLITEKHKSFGLDSCYRNFCEDFKKIDKSKYDYENQVIKYSFKEYEPQYQTISIKKMDNETNVFYFQDNKQQSLLSGKYKIELDFKRKVLIYTNSLDSLEKLNHLNLDSLYLQALEHMQGQKLGKRTSYKSFYSVNNSHIEGNSNLIYSGKFNDYLLLAANVGMSVIGSKIAPEWGASLEFDFRKKGRAFQKFGIEYNTMYLSNEDDFYKISSYGFLSLNYFLRYESKFIHKLSFGYLVSRTGGDFNGKTWNAFWTVIVKDVGFKIGGFHTKNADGKYVTLPSVGLSFNF